MLVQLEQIEADFPFFPRLHAMLATRPNMNPPVITTGVGPNGRKIIYPQPPEGIPIDDTAGGPFAESSGIFDVDPQHQYRNLLEAMAAAEQANVAAAAQANSAVAQPQAPADASHVEPPTNKENAAPPLTPNNMFSSSSYMKALIEKAKSNVKKLPPKRTLEETLLKLSTYVVFLCCNFFLIGRLRSDNMSIIQSMKQEKLNLQKRQQYMEEFKLGLLSIEEYREAVAKLENKVEPPSGERAGSPDWDGGDALPLVAEEL